MRLIFKIKFTILLVFPLSLVHGQQEELDSIRSFLDAHPERDTTRVHALIDYASLTYHDEALNGLPLIKEAIQISREVGFTKGVGFSQTALSGYFYSKGKLDSALIYATLGARILDSIGDTQHILAAYNNMAMIYNNQGKTAQSIDMYQKIYDRIKNESLSVQHAAISNNMAIAYIAKENYDSAGIWFENVLRVSRKLQMPQGIMYGYNGLAQVADLTGENIRSLDYSEKALEISQQIGSLKGQLESLQNLGRTNVALKRFGKATAYFRRALSVADSLEAIRNLAQIYNDLTSAYRLQGKPDSALYAYEQYNLFSDSVLSLEKIQLMEDIEAKYQNERIRKDREIAELKAVESEQEAMLATEVAEKREQQLYMLAGGVVVILIAAGLFVQQQRARRKSELLKQEFQAFRRQVELEKQKREADLAAIKAQMNPHFMFNALNSIQHFIMANDKYQASEYLSKFARLSRTYLDHSQAGEVYLDEEMEALAMYTELELLRFEGRVECVFDFPEELLNDEIHLPAMLVQPFVENSFKHAFPSDRKGVIRITARKTGRSLVICIVDDGVGMSATGENTNLNHRSFASKAGMQRVDLINENSPGKVSVNVSEPESGGTRVEIKIDLTV